MMKLKLVAAALAFTLAAPVVATVSTPAAAQHRHGWNNHDRWDNDRRWNRGWNNDRRWNRGWNRGWGPAVGFGLGFGAGAAAGAYAQDNARNDAYCSQRFRSYDPASGTYLGYDGQRHPCP